MSADTTRFNEALAHLQGGRHALATVGFEALVKANPRHFESWTLLGASHLSMGRYADARRASERAMLMRPGDPRPYHQIATSLLREGKFADMDRALDKGVKACGRDASLIALRAERLQASGDYEGAYQACAPLAPTAPGNLGLVLAFARACAKTGRAPEGVAALRVLLARGDQSPMGRAAALYALSEVCDATGDYDDAFAAAKEANDLKNTNPSPEAQARAVDECIAAWTPERIAALPRGAPTEVPVFIVGFWRSGTTLIEQVLSCHPQVFGAGELTLISAWAYQHRDRRLLQGEPMVTDLSVLTPDAVGRLGRTYLAHLRRLAPRASRITDKLPTNFANLGVITRVFPGARVIHCVRDPVDTCLSCYFNLHGNISYVHGLRALGSFYRDYQRLMGHWERVLDIPILEVRYEEFVADQEAWTRRILEFLGLPWHEACLRPHESARIALTRSIDQVRKPVYRSSIARWKNYEKYLGPLLQALGTVGPDATP